MDNSDLESGVPHSRARAIGNGSTIEPERGKRTFVRERSAMNGECFFRLLRGRVLRTSIVFVLLGGWWAGCQRTPEGGLTTGNLVPTTQLESSDRLLQLGKQTYDRNCAPCHGVNGDSQGPAAYLLYPRPRDFTASRYRLVSTWDFAPTDEDLFRCRPGPT